MPREKATGFRGRRRGGKDSEVRERGGEERNTDQRFSTYGSPQKNGLRGKDGENKESYVLGLTMSCTLPPPQQFFLLYLVVHVVVEWGGGVLLWGGRSGFEVGSSP